MLRQLFGKKKKSSKGAVDIQAKEVQQSQSQPMAEKQEEVDHDGGEEKIATIADVTDNTPDKENESKNKNEGTEKGDVFAFEYTDHDDLYGQTIPVETPDLLSTKFQELENELDRIPESDKKDYLRALQKCPHLFSTNDNNDNKNDSNNAFKLMFLRCEIFNADLAAKRIVKYWKTRVEIFGEDKAFLPLVLGDGGPFALSNNGDDEDYTSMKIGFLRCTDKRDDAGRPIIFGDPSRMPIDHSSYDVKSMVRTLWYTLHYVLRNDETAQRKGVVIIMFPKHIKFAQFNRKLAKMNAESIKGCIPIRLSAIHICHPPVVFDLIFPVVKVLMGSKLRKKIQLNSGSEEKVLEKFEQKFGMKRNDLPTELGGSLVLDQDQWLDERRRNGQWNKNMLWEDLQKSLWLKIGGLSFFLVAPLWSFAYVYVAQLFFNFNTKKFIN